MGTKKKEKTWRLGGSNAQTPNPAWKGAAFYFFLWAATGISGPFLNVHFSQIGLSGLQIGILSAIYPLIVLTLSPWLSALADRKHWHKPLLVVGQGLAAVCVFLLQFPRSFAPILVLTVLRSIVASPIMPIADGLIARMAARHQVDYGKLRLWGSLSFALATLTGGALWQRTGFGLMFLVSVVLAMPVMIMATTLESTVSSGKKPVRLSLRILRQDRGTLALLASMFLIGIAEGMYITFSGVYMDALGGGQFLVGGLFGFSALLEIVVMRASGAIHRKLGKPLTVTLAFGVVGLSMFGYALSRAPWVLVGFAVLKGVGFALYFVGVVSLTDERAPDEWTTTLQSMLNAANRGLAPLLTMPMSGWLADTLGLSAAFVGGGITAMIAAGVMGVAVAARWFEKRPLVER